MSGPLRLLRKALLSVRSGIDSALWALIRFGRAMAIIGVAVGACVGVAVVCATWEVLRLLPESHYELMDGRDRGSVTVLDRYGNVLGLRGDRFHPLTMEAAGRNVTDAVLSTEDRRFFWHLGVDPIGLARAVLVNWRAGRTEQGGSSITQQVAKLAFLTNERRLGRKLREAPLALALEWRFTKEQIFEIYLNRAYLGGGAFGFRAAAKFYFEKEPGKLNRAEAALLAGLLRAPSKWSPLSDFSSAQDRARIVVDAMLDAGSITPEERDEARSQIGFLKPPQLYESASFFVDWADAQIPERFWNHASDLELITTLDPIAQGYAEQAVAKVFQSSLVNRRDKDAEASMVILSPDGAVRAMVGGRDYLASQFNRASQARRQLGSAFKPFVYATALASGIPPGSYVRDEPVAIGSWRPGNYSHSYRGPIPMTMALAKSSNVASVRLTQSVGVKQVVETAKRFGFSGNVPPYPSIALGVVETNPLEVAAAYATIARSGQITPAYGVSEVRERGGRVLWRRQEPPRRQAIPQEDAENLVTMMRAVVQHGTGRRAALGERPVAGKTGTTQEYRDAWFAGFSGNYVAVVWMGKDDFAKTQRVTGGNVPAQIWKEAMEPLHTGEPVAALHQREFSGSWSPDSGSYGESYSFDSDSGRSLGLFGYGSSSSRFSDAPRTRRPSRGWGGPRRRSFSGYRN